MSRNCIDVVHDWVMQNREFLREQKIEIEAIIANRSLRDENVVFVRERSDLKHIDYLGLGQMMEKEKRAVLSKNSIFIGDADDEQLRPFIKQFVRI